MNPVTLSIVLPCYNPPAGWLDVISSDIAFIRNTIPNIELIVVNDGSNKLQPTGIAEQLAAICPVKYLYYKENQGKGYALRQGIQQAKGNWIIYTDVDLPYTRDSFMAIYEALKTGSDVAIGIRPQSYYNSLPKSRVFISKSLRFMIRTLLRIPTDDTQCGLKGFNQKGREVFLKTTINRYLFDMEFIKLSSKRNLKIQLCEVHLKENIAIPAMPVKVLMQEGKNFLKILFS